MNLFHIFQAGAFIDYSSKFTLKDKEQFLDLFNNWAESKMLCEEDKKKILKFAEEHYEEKCKEAELRKNRKLRKQKNEIPQDVDDVRQIKFDFLESK